MLDIACGKGTTAVLLAKKYGCAVEGIDISEDMIGEANDLARRKDVNARVNFRVGDAMDLPYSDGEFDVTLAQAMLILLSDKEKAVQEAKRVLKPGSYSGWLELSWAQDPPKEFMRAVSDEICASCMTNVLTYENWERLFYDSRFSQIEVFKFSMDMNGMRGMIQNEGFSNSVKVISKYLFNSRVRHRMNTLNTFINHHPQYFGYGIYITKK